MNRNSIYLTILLLIFSQLGFSQKTKTDANIVGHVAHKGTHLSFATISIKGTTIGTVSDETGHYQLVHLPLGEHIISVTLVGYKPKERTVFLEASKTIEVKFELEEDLINLEEVVVSADRSQQKRTEAPIIVNTLSPKLFNTTQSVTLGECLNFSPGLRLENNCQNCGFTQVRMNGMEGPYSQILINSRPIFSGLAGVYGLELIPSSMIDKVEVVRGGSSALFGSNAIAGTINIILKDPKANIYEGGANYALTGVGMDGTGGLTPDYSVNFNTSIVSDDHKSGLSLYGFTRKREMFDANDDSFSEIAAIENITFGARVFHRFGYRDKLALDFFTINEKRDGGNRMDYPLHERDISESLKHNMKVAALTFEHFVRQYDLLSVYASGQYLDRDSYYGAERSLKDYGNTKDKSFNAGAQYKAVFGNSSLIGGVETTGGFLLDNKLGYPDLENAEINFSDSTISYSHTDNTTISDQSSITTGAFLQYDIKINKLKIAAGARYDHYIIKDLNHEGPELGNGSSHGSNQKSGNVVSPRLSFMYEVMNSLQARLSYSQGYRAPQIFDEDLHIETSGSRKVIHRNDSGLKQETSHSLTASLDFNKLIGRVYSGFLIEGFYTRLEDAFVKEIGTPDENGTVIYTRVNSDGGAVVKGVNMELKLKPLRNFEFSSGFTLQNSRFETAQIDFNERNFYRTPEKYGFFAIDWDFIDKFCLSTTANYTGSMLVPYFGTANPDGELRTSGNFFDLGARLTYTVKLNGASVQFLAGIKNVFNSYQSDFDRGIYRDPAYVYGPLSPRTIYFGIKFGNLLK